MVEWWRKAPRIETQPEAISVTVVVIASPRRHATLLHLGLDTCLASLDTLDQRLLRNDKNVL